MPSDPMFMSILGPNPSATAVELLSTLQAIAPPASPAGATIYSLNGPSKLVTGSGNDSIYTGDSSDGVYAGLGNNYIYSGAGTDLILALGGDDTVFAGEGDDTVSVGDGNNKVYAADGNNTVIVGGGNDLIYTGHGNDYIQVGNGNNNIYAWDGNNTIIAGSGNDLITAEEGNDVVIAGDGSNTIRAGAGNNIIESGSGDDFIMVAGGNDVVIAGDGMNTVYAGEGNNRVSTGSGNDSVYTGNGDDAIFTGAGNDYIYTGDGNNLVSAGTGNDTVRLGGGRDRVILEAGEGFVTIDNFDASVDKLRLGASLGSSVSFTIQGNDTVVKAGTDVLAILRNVMANQNVIENAPLYRYMATDLGSLSSNPNGNVNAAAINDFGQIAGRYDTGATYTTTSTATPPVVNNNNIVRAAFIWQDGAQRALPTTGVKVGESAFGAGNGATVTMLTPNVNSISNLGVITGTGDEVRQPTGLATDRALLWTITDSGYQLSINDFGKQESYFLDVSTQNQLPGRNISVSGVDTAVIWDNGILSVLPDLGGDGGTARGINNRGQIVGYTDKDGMENDSVANTAVSWAKSGSSYTLTNLGTFGSAQATLRDINEAGNIIGSTSDGSGATATSTPFLIRDGQWTNLGSLGGKTGSVSSLNDFGQVVGTSQIASATNRPFIWSDGVIADLNNLLTTPLTYNGAAVTLTSALGINNFGDIVATGTYSYMAPGTTTTSTSTRSFLLKAVE
jgi:probable HAF family extracellular repeat protein